MSLLVLGLILFLGVHSVRIVSDGWRARTVARIGEGAWKGVYSLLAGVGVHAVNDSRGSLATGVLGAALGALGGFSLTAATDEPVSILFLPFLQAGAAAIAERATTPRDPGRQEDP